MAIVFTLTSAGRAALVNSSGTGTNAHTVVSVGVTATSFTPAGDLTAIPGEIKRLTTISGELSDEATIHATIRDDGTDVYTVRGFGLYLDDGTLLGTYSQAAVIVEKSAGAIMMLAADLRVVDASVSVGALQFGDANFINPPATTVRQGVARLATAAETAAGSDAATIVTPATLKPLLDLKAAAAVLMTAGTGLTGGGSLAANRTIALGTPSSITSTSTNTAAGTTHSHALDSTGVTAGNYGSATQTPTFSVDAKGRILAAAAVTITPAWGSITGKPTTVGGYGITDAMTTAWTLTAGNGLSGGGTGAANRTLTLATPSTIGNGSTNSVTASSHTHALTVYNKDIGEALSLANIQHMRAGNATGTTYVQLTNILDGNGDVDGGGVVEVSSNGTVNFKYGGSFIVRWGVDGSMTAGSVPWGRLTGAPTLTAGNGLSGGGDLSATRTLTLGTPSDITTSSTNSVTTSSHTHNLDLSGLSITAGNGLSGGGTLAATRTLTLGTPSDITASSTNSVTTSSHTHNLDLSGLSITAGNGLTGGGTLAATRTITLGTPGSLTSTSTNAVTSTSHTHALDISGFFSQSLAAAGYTTLPNGLILQWGSIDIPGNGGGTAVFPIAFTSAVYSIQLTSVTNDNLVGGIYITSSSKTGFSADESNSRTITARYYAVGK